MAVTDAAKVVDDDYADLSGVDDKLVRLGQDMAADVVTTDFNLAKVAEIKGVRVLNVNELANAVKTSVLEAHPWVAMNLLSAFEEAKLERAWAGYYEVNDFDHNGIVGPHPSIPNLHFMNGFSGHGLMQAPAVARGLAERIVGGRYSTIDLAPLGFARLLENRPLVELNVIG